MRHPIWAFGLVLLLVYPASGPKPSRARPHPDRRVGRGEAGRPPNVLLIVADDLFGGALGIDGDPRAATPNLDRLARSGVRFDRAYCNAPICTASRQSFLTGRLPHAAGVTRLRSALADEAVTLADWLGELGYATAAFGKMHFNSLRKHGFDLLVDTLDWEAHLARARPEVGRRRPWRPFLDPAPAWLNAENADSGLPADAEEAAFLADRAIDFLRRPRDVPFFLVVGFHEPHSPFVYPRGWPGRYDPAAFPVPSVTAEDLVAQPAAFAGMTPAQVRGVQAAYFSSVSWMDHQAGRVLDALADAGLDDSTVVVFLGDNGYLLGQHGRFEKNCFLEPAVRVPLIFRWPGHLPAGRRTEEPVELVDVVPTVLGLAGLSRPPALHGQDLGGLLRGEPGAAGREVVVSTHGESEAAMARGRRYKLVVGNGLRRRADGLASRAEPAGPYTLLFDMEADPRETTDLSARPEMAPVIAGLREALLRRLTRTREGLEPVPSWLDDAEALAWCLVSRDPIPHPDYPRPRARKSPGPRIAGAGRVSPGPSAH